MNTNIHLIRFKGDSGNNFQELLKKRIEAYFERRGSSIQGTPLLLAKTVFFLSWMIISYALLFRENNSLATEFILFTLFGLGSAFFVMNVAHDASHHSYSGNRRINKLLSYSWNLVGMSSYMWELKHNHSHHTFTNVIEHDVDISQSKLIRLNPGQELKWFHRFQLFYAPVAYAILSLFIVFVKDFMMFGQDRFGNRQVKHPVSEWVILILTKLFYCFYMLLIPLYFLPFGWVDILLCFFVMHAVIGITIAFILTPPHINGDTWYLNPDENGIIHSNWFVHQVETTTDFAAGSPLAAWFTGGLNTHVAHHLYPGISHIHYRNITPIIAMTARECGIRYLNRSFFGAIYEHFRFLKILGHRKSLDQIKKTRVESRP